MFLSLDEDDLSANLPELIQTYYDELVSASGGKESAAAPPKLPWKSAEEFESALMSEGVLITLLYAATAYMHAQKNEKIKARDFYLFRRVLQGNPEVFE